MKKRATLFEKRYFEIKVSVREIRKKLMMTQEEFSRTFGIPLSTLKNWEQGRRGARPRTTALLLLKLIEESPESVGKEVAKILRVRKLPSPSK